MRAMCLALPDTVEGDHFGESCFRVGRKIFATCGEKDGVCRIVFQLTPDHARRLMATDARFVPYARAKDGVWMDAAGVTDWDEVRALVLESYGLNAPAGREGPRVQRLRPRRAAGAHRRVRKRS
jgi:predicted DNA-binding protein (MmcQ/YjbR family)